MQPLKQYLLYQGAGSSDYDIFMTLNAYDADGTYPGSARLSANSDSDGNDIPLGEWHKIHMPNPIILNTVNIAARNGETGRPRKWSIYGSNDDSIWTLLLFKANDRPGVIGGTTYTMDHQALPFEYFAIVVEETDNYEWLNIAAISWFGQEVKTITKHIQNNISNEKYLFGFLKNRFSNAEIKVYGDTNISYLAASVLNKPPIEFILTPNESFSIDFFVRLNVMDTLPSDGDTVDPKNYYMITRTKKDDDLINSLKYDVNYYDHNTFVFDQELESQFRMTTGVSTTIGEWTHIAMTFDATNNQLKAFFNGTEDVNTNFSSVNTSQWDTFQLPGFQRGPEGPGADIDYVYNFYPNKILTQIEVNDLQGKTQDNISTIFNYYN